MADDSDAVWKVMEALAGLRPPLNFTLAQFNAWVRRERLTTIVLDDDEYMHFQRIASRSERFGAEESSRHASTVIVSYNGIPVAHSQGRVLRKQCHLVFVPKSQERSAP